MGINKKQKNQYFLLLQNDFSDGGLSDVDASVAQVTGNNIVPLITFGQS